MYRVRAPRVGIETDHHDAHAGSACGRVVSDHRGACRYVAQGHRDGLQARSGAWLRGALAGRQQKRDTGAGKGASHQAAARVSYSPPTSSRSPTPAMDPTVSSSPKRMMMTP